MDPHFKFDLGAIVKDKVTGFMGAVVCRTEYATGCRHYGLQGLELVGGRIAEWTYLDESRLIVTDKPSLDIVVQSGGTSGPSSNPPQW